MRKRLVFDSDGDWEDPRGGAAGGVTDSGPRGPGWQRLATPLWLLSNGAVYLACAAAQRLVRIEPGDEPAVQAARAQAGGPVLYIAWHRYNYVLAQLMLRWPEPLRPTLIMHDGLASRALTHESSAWLGFTTFVFTRRGRRPPRQQIRDYITRTGASILLLPDAGGPYGVVKPGIVELAAACAAPVQPLGVRCQGTLRLGRTLRHELPRPGCRLTLRAGPLLPAAVVTRERCQAELEALELPPAADP